MDDINMFGICKNHDTFEISHCYICDEKLKVTHDITQITENDPAFGDFGHFFKVVVIIIALDVKMLLFYIILKQL